ncbi:hypothetical protein Vafri_17017 [Volvox africanus]|uniref:Uncharacterized protein n=1 Tax=Volvox africanus TaxID=51714 RepID=A0A8J4BK81_9CHLO|nr:hypothetical protein Vafri_17017 [Volvox africanus]
MMEMDASVTSPRQASSQEDVQLRLLQLQCIIDAKDREMQLLRKQLSSPEESDEKVALLAEVAQLRGEVQQLANERNALRLQSAAAAARNDGTTAAQAKQTLGSGSQQQAASMAVPGSNPFAHPPHAVGAGANPAVAAALTDGKVQPASPAALQTVDSGALVEKLRALVTGLVAEALATQQQRPTGLCPPTPFLTHQQQQQQQEQQAQSHAAFPIAANSPNAGGHSRQAPGGGHPVVAAHPSARPTWSEAGQQAPPPPPPQAQAQAAVGLATPVPFVTVPAAATVAPEFLTGAAMARGTWPGVHIIVPQLPSMQLQPVVAISWEPLTGTAVYGLNGLPIGTAIAEAPAGPAAGGLQLPPPPNPIGSIGGTSGTRVTVTTAAGCKVEHTAAAAAAAAPTHIGCNADGAAAAAAGAVPAVLELNVDGTVVLVERAVLESEAAGSRLYRTLIQGYDKLPLDSQGRPYLSYEPRTFKLLISHLKVRYLFGRTAAGKQDYGRMAEALGVPRQYVAQMASHFGLADDLCGTSPPHAFDPVMVEVTSHQQQQQQQQQQQSSTTPQRSPPASAPRAGGFLVGNLHTAPPPNSQSITRSTWGPHSPWGVPEQAGAGGGGGFYGGSGFREIPVGLSVGQPWDYLPSLRVLPPEQSGINGDGTVGGGGSSQRGPSTEAVQLPLTNGVNCSGSGNVHRHNGSEDEQRRPDTDTMSTAPSAGTAPLAVGTTTTAALDATTPIEAFSGNGNGNGSSLDVRANGVSGTGSGSFSLPPAEPTTASPFISGASGRPQAQQTQQLQPQTVANPNRQPLTSSPSRIPPPPQPVPTLHRPAPAPPAPAETTIPASDAATAAPTVAAPGSTAAAAVAGYGHADGSPHAKPVASPPGWWQPFHEDAVPAAAAPQREPDDVAPAPAPALAPAPARTASGPAAAAAAAAGVAAPANVAPDLAVPALTAHAAATWPVSTAAAMAATAERYRVPNLYEILAKKQRLELESEAGKIA